MPKIMPSAHLCIIARKIPQFPQPILTVFKIMASEFDDLRRDLILDQIGAERYLRRLARGVKSPEDRARVPRLGVSLRGRIDWEPPTRDDPHDKTQRTSVRPSAVFDPLPIAPFIIASRDHTEELVPQVSSILAASRATTSAASQITNRQPTPSPPSSSEKGQYLFTLSDFKVQNAPQQAASPPLSSRSSRNMKNKSNSKSTQKKTNSKTAGRKQSPLARMKRHRRRSTRRPVEFSGTGKEKTEPLADEKPGEDKLNHNEDEEFWAMMDKAEAALAHSTSATPLDYNSPQTTPVHDLRSGSGSGGGCVESIKSLLISHAVEHLVVHSKTQDTNSSVPRSASTRSASTKEDAKKTNKLQMI